MELSLVCRPTGLRGAALPKPPWDSHFSVPNIYLCSCPGRSPGTDTWFELVIILWQLFPWNESLEFKLFGLYFAWLWKGSLICFFNFQGLWRQSYRVEKFTAENGMHQKDAGRYISSNLKLIHRSQGFLTKWPVFCWNASVVFISSFVFSLSHIYCIWSSYSWGQNLWVLGNQQFWAREKPL